MQMERVWRPNSASRDGELNSRATGETVYASLGKEVLGQLHATQDLQEDGDGRELERHAVDKEPERDSDIWKRLDGSDLASCKPMEIIQDVLNPQGCSEHSPLHRRKALRAVQYRIS